MQVLDRYAPHAHWLLRFALGAVFLYHGLEKFTNLSAMAGMMGMPVFMLAMVALAETAGGALILVGGFTKDWITRVGAAAVIPVMLGAIAMVHWPRWSFTPSETHPMGGMEFQVTILLIALYFVLTGNGQVTRPADAAGARRVSTV